MNVIFVFSFILGFIAFNFNTSFSQSDSTYKTDNVFSLSYKDFNNEIQNMKDIRLTDIDSISLTFEEVIYGRSSNENKYIKKKIVFDRIDKFGYRTSMSMGSRTMIGAGIGFGSVFLLGAIMGAGYDPGGGTPSTANKVGVTFLLSVAAAVPGAVIGMATGIGRQEYEVLDISKYHRAKKFEILKRLIRNGVKVNE